ncbi:MULTISPECIES: extracellular solute-binding protein [Paracoccus]|jgi:microcin C transport system substrate-binding protein|nr:MULTISPECIES: extracellular solute-binding protein [Paracoccus]MBB4626984.1 microcin C transport system substrate-binding protein [Paracoccus denitrificans]MCU7428370.1 extracellular solute-binding protein [Paracoccus denitrificans]QAR25293.1 ABC transporter substrate-binding protein [Paracoccus denitrificans]UPV94176.1 extracellular solute-binding protein [Paracoccus denitrificans]WQO33782.1 extracellular solute-binding protein [Paracoccus denitrificans]
MTMRFLRHAPMVALVALLPGWTLAQEQQKQEPKTIVSHGISVFGEPELPADFPHLRYVNPEAPKGGEISESWLGGFDSYNPFTHRGRAGRLSVIMLERLMEDPADERGSSYCLLCETIEYPESRDWVIFHLRPEAKFSDGSPLTAHDVLFSFELLRDRGLSSYRTGIAKMVAKAEVIDDHTIKFIFQPDYPRRDVIQQAGSQIVFSREDFRKNDRDIERSSNIPFLGSGPYVFDAAEMGRSMTVRRNPDYWGKDLPINVGRHNFDKIRFEYFTDYDAAFEAFKAGVYTFRNEVSSIHWATRYDFPALRSGAVKREMLPNGDLATGQSWIFNLRREKWQDIRVREAIGLVFNFEWSNETLFYGLNTRVNSFWDNSDLAATGKPSGAELELLKPLAKDLPEGVLTEDAVVQPVSGKSQLDRRNLRKASALLDEAGWKAGSDGMRVNAKGERLKLEILNDNQSFDRIINPFVQNLRALGIDAVNARVDDAQMTARTRSHDFDMITDNFLLGFYVGGGTEQVFGSENVGDVFNPAGLANPAIDALIEKGIQATTQEEMDTIIHALDRSLRALRFWVPQWYKAEHTVAYYDIFAHPETLPPYALGELDFWWYDADKAEKLKQSGALR